MAGKCRTGFSPSIALGSPAVQVPPTPSRDNRSMHTLLSLMLVLAATTIGANPTPIDRVLDDWHKAAADADEVRYFGYAAPEFVFLGTDARERWDLASFRAFAHPYFV